MQGTSSDKVYPVTTADDTSHCTYRDFANTHRACKMFRAIIQTGPCT